MHAWSEVVDPTAFHWTDGAWRGLDPRDAVIYELHVGAFTPEGTFASAAARLPYVRDLGVTAIELMPLADFAGRRNWGYDGVALFAPSRAYGRPDDLRALVDAAHALGLAVLIDVVYNHLGPEGAYLPSFSPQFLTARHQTPWGDAVNLDDRGSETVRRLLADNALHWILEYHADGLRLDATHALIDGGPTPFVAELAEAVHAAADPPPLVYAEDHRNLSAPSTTWSVGCSRETPTATTPTTPARRANWPTRSRTAGSSPASCRATSRRRAGRPRMASRCGSPSSASRTTIRSAIAHWAIGCTTSRTRQRGGRPSPCC